MELQASGKTVGKPTGSSTDLVERAFDAFTDRDLGALLDAAAPDIELNAPGTAALARQVTRESARTFATWPEFGRSSRWSHTNIATSVTVYSLRGASERAAREA